MSADRLPPWAAEMRAIFRAGATSQFVLSGNVFDLVAAPGGEQGRRFLPLTQFLTDVMLAPFDVVIVYDRGRGIRVRRGADAFHRFLKAFDTFQGTSWAALPDVGPDKVDALDLGNLLPREPKRALELVDRFIRGAMARVKLVDGKPAPDPLRVAVIVEYAHFVAPQGDALYVSGDAAETLIRLLDWASDPAITGAYVATVLIAESLADLNRAVVESPHSAKLAIGLPQATELAEYLDALLPADAELEALSEVPREVLAAKLVGLSRVAVRSLVLRARHNQERITGAYLTRRKKELIEKEAFGRLEFLESARTLDDVAGHEEAKTWLRQDAVLLRKGRTTALPMGYLLTGRIGTGKTYLVECWAGEVGVPCVELKNFREKWVGSTEANLEKIFGILHALGQVVVFVDEADQATGRRGGGDGDSGLSGRIYGMLAREMSNTANRGKIVWVFATSRPDLLEVDLKRQGRLDVHIPLFPPGDPASRAALFAAMARKLKLEIDPGALPALPDNDQIGGNEMEGILVRALREHEAGTPGPDGLTGCIARAIADFRPSAHTERLELMDLLAVKECTDARFLPARFRSLAMSEVNARIAHLKGVLGE